MDKKCEKCMDKKLKEEVTELLKNYSSDKDNLIKVLEDIQEKYGYIPQVAQLAVAEHLKMPLAEVYGVITFYSRFTTGSDLERAKTISGAVNFIVAPDKDVQKQTFIKEALMLKQALSLCSSMVKEHMRLEAT